MMAARSGQICQPPGSRSFDLSLQLPLYWSDYRASFQWSCKGRGRPWSVPSIRALSGFDLGELLEDDHPLGLGKAGDCSRLGLNAQARASLPLCGNPIIRDCGRHVAVPTVVQTANHRLQFAHRRRKPSSFKVIVGNRKLQRASCTILDHRSRNFCEAEPFSI